MNMDMDQDWVAKNGIIDMIPKKKSSPLGPALSHSRPQVEGRLSKGISVYLDATQKQVWIIVDHICIILYLYVADSSLQFTIS